MKRFVLAIAFLVFVAGGMAAGAQGLDRRVDVARSLNDEQPNIHPERHDWRGRDVRLAAELDYLDRQVRRVGRDIQRLGGDRHLRRRYARLASANESLQARFRRGADRGQLWRDARDLRANLARIEEELDRRFPRRSR